MTISRPAILTGVALSALLLTGCTGTTTPAPSGGATSDASASPSASPSRDADELFRITAVLVSPEGSRIEITQRATAPSALTADDSALLAENQCDAQLASVVEPIGVHVTATSRVLSGDGPDADRDIFVLESGATFVDGLTPTAYAGSWRGYQAYCADGLLTIPGTATDPAG